MLAAPSTINPSSPAFKQAAALYGFHRGRGASSAPETASGDSDAAMSGTRFPIYARLRRAH